MAGWPAKKTPFAFALEMSSNVDSAVSPGSDAGTRRQDFDTALSPTDGIDSGIQGLKTGCGTDTGRVIAAVPRRRLVGLSGQRARDATVPPCAANSCAEAKPIPPLPPGKALHTRSSCGGSHTAVAAGWKNGNPGPTAGIG